MTDTAPASRQAFRDLLDLLREIGDTHFTPQRGVIEEVTGAEAYRFVLHLLAAGTEHHLEGDPARPLFTRVVSPQRKLLGDNPDAIYYWTRIDGTRSYRIRGNLAGASYTSFTVHGRDPAGGSMERVIADVNDDDLAIAKDGHYEIAGLARALRRQLAAPRTRRDFDHHAPLLRARDVGAERSRRRDPAAHRSARGSRSARARRRTPHGGEAARRRGAPARRTRSACRRRRTRRRTRSYRACPTCCRRRRISAPRAPPRSAPSISTTRWRRTCSGRTTRW